VSEVLKVRSSYDKIVFIIILGVYLVHINSCVWVYLAKEGYTGSGYINWVSNNVSMNEEKSKEHSAAELYIASFYFVITTITTVGYGDFSAETAVERVACCIMMIIGVLSFSFSTGSLSSFLTQLDGQKAAMKAKLHTLDQIQHKYDLSFELYDEIRKMIRVEH